MVQPRALRSTWTCGASSFPMGTSGAHGAGSRSASLSDVGPCVCSGQDGPPSSSRGCSAKDGCDWVCVQNGDAPSSWTQALWRHADPRAQAEGEQISLEQLLVPARVTCSQKAGWGGIRRAAQGLAGRQCPGPGHGRRVNGEKQFSFALLKYQALRAIGWACLLLAVGSGSQASWRTFQLSSWPETGVGRERGRE